MHELHKLILLDDDSPLLKEGGVSTENGIDITYSNELERYILSVGKALSSLSSSMEKALLTLILLDANYLEQLADGNKQDKSSFIELLIENSIIRVQSIYDRVLIFSNRLLDLGISNESIGHSALVTNEHVKAYGLDTKLKAINRACNEYRLARNTVIHHDRFSEEELDRLTMVLQAEHLSQQEKDVSIINQDLLDLTTANYLEVKQEEFVTYLSVIENKITELFDDSVAVYQLKKKQLRANL